jgi:hypothetical protein
VKAVKTPTLDKAMAVLSESHTIGEFLDWLRDERKIQLAEYVEVAHAFFEGDESKVVNGVLDHIARQVGAHGLSRESE